MTGIERLREWANELREAARAYRDGEIGYVTLDVEACQRKNAARLDSVADQIERETERTCKLTRVDSCSGLVQGTTQWMTCSRCGIEVLAYPATYCPCCGAKVVR